MNINEAFPSKWLKAADIPDGSDLILTIDCCKMEVVGGEDTQPVLSFQDCEKGLVLKKTNATTIGSLYGPLTEAWEGKKIALFATEVDYQGKQMLAIRVRMRAPGQKPATVAAPATGETDPFDGSGPILCGECGAEVTPNQALLSERKYKMTLCPSCQKKRPEAEA